MDREIRAILASVVHPETEENLVDGGFVESISATEEKITVGLRFRKSRDPFAVKIKNRVEQLITELYPDSTVTVFIKQVDNSAAKRKEQIDQMHKNTTIDIVYKLNLISPLTNKQRRLTPKKKYIAYEFNIIKTGAYE